MTIGSLTVKRMWRILLGPTPFVCSPTQCVEFVTALTNSQGFTTILTVIVRFSKACHLVLLIRNAMEMATQLFHYVFWNCGIPEDIVYDQGLQFTLWHEQWTGGKAELLKGNRPLLEILPQPRAGPLEWVSASLIPQQDLLCSIVYWVINQPCFLGQENHPTYPQWRSGWDKACMFEKAPMSDFSGPSEANAYSWTDGEVCTPNTDLSKESGFWPENVINTESIICFPVSDKITLNTFNKHLLDLADWNIHLF